MTVYKTAALPELRRRMSWRSG